MTSATTASWLTVTSCSEWLSSPKSKALLSCAQPMYEAAERQILSDAAVDLLLQWPHCLSQRCILFLKGPTSSPAYPRAAKMHLLTYVFINIFIHSCLCDLSFPTLHFFPVCSPFTCRQMGQELSRAAVFVYLLVYYLVPGDLISFLNLSSWENKAIIFILFYHYQQLCGKKALFSNRYFFVEWLSWNMSVSFFWDHSAADARQVNYYHLFVQERS